MFRYVALVWQHDDAVGCETTIHLLRRLRQLGAEWRDAIAGPGVRVLCTDAHTGGNDCLALPNQGGAVLGRIFEVKGEATSSIARAGFTALDAEEIHRTSGRVLIDRFWGNYVAFLASRAGGAARVIRGPMSSLPCYFHHYRNVYVFFSDIQDCRRLGLPLTINWRFVAATMRFRGGLGTAETGLNQVMEIRPGECIEIQPRRVARTFYWNPFEIAATNPIEDRDRAAAQLRSTTEMCVGNWASSHPHVLHLLSGGLDSSIVLACLERMSSRPSITCLNYHSPGSDTDEREFARMAARRAGCEVVERQRRSDLDLTPMLDITPRAPIPGFYVGSIENSRDEAALASELGATAICAGVGGDQLFYQSNAGFAVRDYMQDRGLDGSLASVAYHAARLDKKSVWHLLRMGAAERLLGRRWHPLDELPNQGRFLPQEIFEDDALTKLFIHPWMASAENVPSGKRFHVYTLVVPRAFYYDATEQPGDPDHLYPLFSQPLVELCLRMPTYVLTAGGWDRSVARHAFAEAVPKEIIWRSSKGGMEEHMRAIMVRNLGLIQEALLDGALAQHGLIDRRRIEEFLALRPTRIIGGMPEVYEYLSLEIWLRNVAPPSKAIAA